MYKRYINFIIIIIIIWHIEQCWNLAVRHMTREWENKAKKVFFVTFLTVLLAIFGFLPIRMLDLIEIND